MIVIACVLGYGAVVRLTRMWYLHYPSPGDTFLDIDESIHLPRQYFSMTKDGTNYYEIRVNQWGIPWTVPAGDAAYLFSQDARLVTWTFGVWDSSYQDTWDKGQVNDRVEITLQECIDTLELRR